MRRFLIFPPKNIIAEAMLLRFIVHVCLMKTYTTAKESHENMSYNSIDITSINIFRFSAISCFFFALNNT